MHQHYHYFHYFKNKELDELYISIAFRSFALSMISVFIPIYLLNLNYSLQDVIIFFIIMNVFHAVASFLAASVSSNYGFKHSILISTPLVIVFYLMLYSLQQYSWPLWLIASFCGSSAGFFWVGFHTDFTKSSKKNIRGQEVSYIHIILSLANVLGPVIGGIILASAGFRLLFSIVMILLIVSVGPLFFTKDKRDPIDFSFKNIFHGQNIRETVALMGYGIEARTSKIIWPIFIFLNIINTFTGLGFLTSLTLLSSLIFSLFIGKYADLKKKFILKSSSVANSIIWLIKSFVATKFHVYIIDQAGS